MAQTSGAGGPPVLTGAARDAVFHRGSPVQIIAAAGSGKTEVVSQRVAELIAAGVPPAAIVAFTFTEKAADELKDRIAERIDARLGGGAVSRLAGLSVGTIHAYCFRLLQQYVPSLETYDVLDDNQLTAFLSREARRLRLRSLDPRNRLFAAIKLFIKNVDVVENELLAPETMPDPFRSLLLNYYDCLAHYRLLTFGQQVVRAVKALETPAVAQVVHAQLRHLIVDEYQDINPAQERLITLLAGPNVEVCVVGDDQQAIYQWRGANVSNILEFPRRYPSATSFEITVNRRSRPTIVQEADAFAQTIAHRIPKTMTAHRDPADGGAEVIAWSAPTEAEEAAQIADWVLQLHEAGAPFRDMAVLVRSRTVYRQLLKALAAVHIPVQPGGRSGLFEQPEAQVLGRTCAWLADIEWREAYGRPLTISDNALVGEYRSVFGLSKSAESSLRDFLVDWKSTVPDTDRTADLVGELYGLLEVLAVRKWDASDPETVSRLGSLARFSALLADYESVRRRARPDAAAPGEQVGGEDRGLWYYRNLAIHIINYAQGAFDGFEGEAELAIDAVDLMTVHKAKGLEWPIVFIPSLTATRFPTRQAGSPQDWLVPRTLFNAARYEGGDEDERRLFYVAMTRARDWLSLSRHERVTKQVVAPSPYFLHFAHLEINAGDITVPPIEARMPSSEDALVMTYSELAAFLDCGYAYRLRHRLGFQPRVAPELGYGKAVHHVMRRVAEMTRETKHIPTGRELDHLLDANFFLPMAGKAAHRELKAAARRLVGTYTAQYASDLHRVWETERPFELRLDGVTVTGRADVILDHEGGTPGALALVDYKTSTDATGIDYALQLQVYADAGRREGLDVRGAYVHDLKRAARDPIPIDDRAMERAEHTVRQAADRLRRRDYKPNPGTRCRRCEVRTICASAMRRT